MRYVSGIDERAKDRVEDFASTGIVAAASLVPIFGGPLSVFANAALGSAAQRRTEAELDKLRATVAEIDERVDDYIRAVDALRCTPLSWWSVRGSDTASQGSFVGRRVELDQLRLLAATTDEGSGCQIAICGIAGVGKSSLAYQHAFEQRPGYRTVTYVDGSSREALNAALGFIITTRQTSTDPMVDQAGERDLLIVDGVAEPSILLSLPAQFRPYNVIATVQGRSAPKGWRELAVQGFDDEHELVSFANAWFPSAQAGDIKMLGQQFEGNPLAIGQALAFCDATDTPVAEYVAMLDAPTGGLLLHDGAERLRNTAVARQLELSMNTAFEASSDAKQLLVLLSLFGETPVPDRFLTSSTKAAFLRAIDQPYGETVADPITKEIGKVLEDKVRWTRAINVLRDYWLVDPQLHGTSKVHSLVRRAVSLVDDDRRPYLEVALGCFLRTANQEDSLPVLAMTPSTASQLDAVLHACTTWKVAGLPVAFLSLRLATALAGRGEGEGALGRIEAANEEIASINAGEFRDQMSWFSVSTEVDVYALTGQNEKASSAADRLVEMSEKLGQQWLVSARIKRVLLVSQLSKIDPSQLLEDLPSDGDDVDADLIRAVIKVQIFLRNDQIDQAALELEHADGILAADHKGVEMRAWVESVRSDVLRAQGRATEATAALRRRYDLLLATHPEVSEGSLGIRRRIEEADSLLDDDRWEEALDVLRTLSPETIDFDPRLKGRYRAIQGRAFLEEFSQTQNVGALNTAIGRLKQALRLLGSDASQHLASVHYHLASAYLVACEYTEAENHAEEAKRIDTEIFSSEHSEVRRDAELLAFIVLTERVERGQGAPVRPLPGYAHGPTARKPHGRG